MLDPQPSYLTANVPAYIAQITPSSLPQQPVQPALLGTEVAVVVVSAVLGIVSWMGKRLIAEQDAKIKSLSEKVAHLENADSLISGEIREVKLEMSQNYVTKEAFLHAITVFDAKMDTIMENLKTITISLQVEKELRKQSHDSAR